MRRICPVLLLTVVAAMPAVAQHRHALARAIDFPDPPGYLTLVCDLHTHSVFSDGDVWPSIRVQEAVRDGLECMAVTEHLEYQPHRDDIPHPDRMRSFELADAQVPDSVLIVLSGSEITRAMPPGHSNAIFVEDANRLLVDDATEAFREANRQGAFVFWNHPNWTSQRGDGVATLTDVHRELIDGGLLHGIEVVNDITYSEEAVQIALENDLTMVGTSDIHGLIDWAFDVPGGGHRPATLVFGTERSEQGIREALFAGRTAVWFDNTLIGRAEHLVPLLEASLGIERAVYAEDTSVLHVMLRNDSDAPLMLMNESGYTFHREADLVVVEPHSRREIVVKTIATLDSIGLTFDVVNTVTAPGERARITLRAPVEDEDGE